MAPSKSSPQEYPSFRAMRLVEVCEATLADCMERILGFLRDNASSRIELNLLKAYHSAEDYDQVQRQLSSGGIQLRPALEQYLRKMGEGEPEAWYAVANCLLLSISSCRQHVADSHLVSLFQQILAEYFPQCPPVVTAASGSNRSGLRYIVITELDYQRLIRLLPRLGDADVQGLEDWWHLESSRETGSGTEE